MQGIIRVSSLHRLVSGLPSVGSAAGVDGLLTPLALLGRVIVRPAVAGDFKLDVGFCWVSFGCLSAELPEPGVAAFRPVAGAADLSAASFRIFASFLRASLLTPVFPSRGVVELAAGVGLFHPGRLSPEADLGRCTVFSTASCQAIQINVLPRTVETSYGSLTRITLVKNEITNSLIRESSMEPEELNANGTQ